MKKRILFVGDVDNWAMHHVYQYMQKELNRHYIFNYCNFADFLKHKWIMLLLYNRVYISYGRLLGGIKFNKIFKRKIVTGVHCHWEFSDHASAESALKTAETIPPGYIEILNKANRVAAISRTLYEILKKQMNNVYYLPYAIDPEIYYPEDKKTSDGFFHVGWAQSESNHGFKRRIKEIEQVCNNLNGVTLDKIGNNEKKLTMFDSLRKWYNSLDCYVCFSIFEGGPLPVLEAMACGIPCISSPVGQVPEIIEDGINGFIVDTKEKLRDRIELLKTNPELRKTIACNARKTIVEKRNPAKVFPYWKTFLE